MISDYPGGPEPDDASPDDTVPENASPEDTADAQTTGEQATEDGPAFPAGADGTGDTSVDRLTARLAGIPELPIDEHHGLYAGLHEKLLAELNADPSADHDAP